MTLKFGQTKTCFTDKFELQHDILSQSSLAYTEIKYSFTQMKMPFFFQTFMTFFLQWNTKEDINPNVLAALLITKKWIGK